ncbi:MAG: oligosaccharide flippase family protein [Clostridia bacterium]|nr:oligosaccharide flippase family protein [Clostridia bacterium]
MRTENSIKNLIYAFVGQAIGIVVSLITRFIFIRFLSQEYLGIDGLFTNILSILSLVELGIGPAMTFSLYKPLAEKDEKKISALMNLYKNSYNIVGGLIIVIGILIMPLLPLFINEMPNINNTNAIYILFVLNSGFSYFYAYKRSLIIADQKKYVATFYRYLFYVILNICQIIILIITKNYILFLVLQILFTVIENIAISKKTHKLYPFLKNNKKEKVEKKTRKEISKNMTAMTIHKIGGVVVKSTDNIILSKFVGLTQVAIYSNYYLIINAVNTVLMQVFNSITASVGNLNVTGSKKKLKEVFDKVFFVNFWIYSVSSICLYILLNHFIKLWVGENYLFSWEIITIIVINFYLTGMRNTVLTYRDALGLYWQDRYKAIFESIINIIASIVLVKIFDTFGVFLGTFISSVTTCLWIEPYILYKYGLKEKVSKYFLKFFVYTVIFIIVGLITYSVSNFLIQIQTIGGLLGKIIICILIPNILYICIFAKTREFSYYQDMLKNIFEKFMHNKEC